MLERWWMYQQQRFSLFKWGGFAAVFSGAAVLHSLLLRRSFPAETNAFSAAHAIGAVLIAFLVVFLCCLQLRIVDEVSLFKQRCVQSDASMSNQLTTDLEVIAVAAGIMQFGLTLALGHLSLLLVLGSVWGYLGLIHQAFFVPTWLRANPLPKTLLRAGLCPLITLYATGCDWLIASQAPPGGIIWFLLVSLFAAIAADIGCLIHAPTDAVPGSQTYTALWGRERAVVVWLGILWLLSITSLLAGMQIQFTTAIALLLPFLSVGAVIVAWRYHSRPVQKRAQFGWITEVWIVSVYVSLGIVPFVLQT
ncbi:hypothetical protein IQ268_18285 [Oculatella sp. LEGE 06141]|uniref:hypothetical protein n=1 Tax=Oculatella sp. LEGE 06141 TaxID=1828648 RepID=UPI00187FA6EF|nr:hypothetical protein [Oculatella sp. LEGE 06141]MBE9180514.1 hypothetical protein [Oculatella sp. LEGE 06141]